MRRPLRAVLRALPLAAALLALPAATARAQASFYGTGGDVFVRYLGASASDRSELWFRVGGWSPNLADYTLLYANRGAGAAAVGLERRLDRAEVGVEVVFALRNTSLAGTPVFFSGAAARNVDGRAHVALRAAASDAPVTLLGAGDARYAVRFGVEDRPAPGADFDYDDLRFEVAGVRTTIAVVPEPASMAMVGVGLIGVAVAYARRRRG